MNVRTKLSVAVAATATAALLAAAPAGAHAGHGSCKEFGTGTAAVAPGGGLGEFASGAARSGMAAETVAGFHESGCEHR